VDFVYRKLHLKMTTSPTQHANSTQIYLNNKVNKETKGQFKANSKQEADDKDIPFHGARSLARNEEL
jgi:hypothetical protein